LLGHHRLLDLLDSQVDQVIPEVKVNLFLLTIGHIASIWLSAWGFVEIAMKYLLILDLD